jgi:hypothetical protein
MVRGEGGKAVVADGAFGCDIALRPRLPDLS